MIFRQSKDILVLRLACTAAVTISYLESNFKLFINKYARKFQSFGEMDRRIRLNFPLKGQFCMATPPR